MTGYRTILDREIGTLPPSTVDVERTIVRRRRRVRRQRVAVAASAVGLAVLAAAVVAQAPEPRGGGFGARQGSATPSARQEDGTQVAARLTTALSEAVDGLIPGATYVQNRTRESENVAALVFNHRFRPPEPTRGGEDYYYATADVEHAGGTGSVSVMVGRLAGDLFGVQRECDVGPLDAKTYQCVPGSGPGGETVLQIELTGDKAVGYQVNVTRRDGVGVSVRVTNYAQARAEAEFDYGRQDSPLPPFTKSQILAIALDPALTV
jgi:hypothetical protein